MEAGPIQYADRLHTLWTPITKARCKEVMTACHACVNATVSRLNVDVNPADLQTSFACYNLEAWWKAKQSLDAGDPEPWQLCQRMLLPCFRLLCRALGQNAGQAQAEFEAVLAELLTESTMKEVLKGKDSRLAWRRVLGCGARLRASGGSFPVLRVMISWYCSVIDGECQVERDLALLKAILVEHQGSMDIDGLTVSDLLELRIDGPKSEKEIASQIINQDLTDDAREGGCLQMTDFTRECQALYLEKYGRRFRCYRVRSDKGLARQKRKNTFADYQRLQRRAVDSLVQHYSDDPDSMQLTCLGVDRVNFVQKASERGPNSAAWDKGLKTFHKTTLNRQKANMAARQCLKMKQALPVPKMRPGDLFKARPGRRAGDVPTLSSSAIVLDLTSDGMESPPLKEQIQRPACPDTVPFPDLLKAKVVVVDDVLAVEQMRTGRCLGVFERSLQFIFFFGEV